MQHSRNKRNISCCFFLLMLLLLAPFAQAQSKWNTPQEANNLKNPYANNTSVLKDAKVLYMANCAPCHGAKGKGDGAAAVALNPKPADHSSDAVQKETDGALFWKISEGHNPMPQYKQTFSEAQRWALVNYIRTLAKNPKK
jgi:mono/diheme cytochrome c family protein